MYFNLAKGEKVQKVTDKDLCVVTIQYNKRNELLTASFYFVHSDQPELSVMKGIVFICAVQ
jgi:hypothetical protein